MEPYASEQEQIETIKRWWRENGKSLVLGLIIGIGGLAGYRYWDESQRVQAESASSNYAHLLQALNDQKLDEARTTGKAIMEGYPGSSYARLSALLLAKLAVDTDDYARARELLAPLAESDADSEIRHIATARLARLDLADGDSAAAAGRIASIPELGEGMRFAELRADILAAQGDVDAARQLYLEALSKAERLGLERSVIQIKLDNLPPTATSDS